MKLIFWLAIFLTACGVTDHGAPYSPPSLQDAQRQIDAATNDAARVATANAFATQERRSTEQSIADAQAATAFAVNVAGTQAAAPLTATVAAFQFEQTQAAATRDAMSTLRAEGSTQIAVNLVATQSAERVDRDRTLSNGFVTLAIVAPVLLCLIVLWYVRELFRGFVKKQKPEFDPDAVRVVRVPGIGILVIEPTSTGVKKEYLPALPPPGETTDPADEFDTEAEPVEQAEDPTRRVTFTGPMSQRDSVTAARETDRRFVLRFLRDAMQATDPDGKKLPDHRAMRYASNTWQTATALIAERIVSKRPGNGGGTFLDCSLKELYEQVGERRYMPRVVVEQSPHPQPVDAAI